MQNLSDKWLSHPKSMGNSSHACGRTVLNLTKISSATHTVLTERDLPISYLLALKDPTFMKLSVHSLESLAVQYFSVGKWFPIQFLRSSSISLYSSICEMDICQFSICEVLHVVWNHSNEWQFLALLSCFDCPTQCPLLFSHGISRNTLYFKSYHICPL